VVSVLATGLKGRGFRPGRGDAFLMAIKIRSKPSFLWEVKPEAPCLKILWACKITLCSMNEMLRRQNSRTFLDTSLSHCYRWCSQRALVDGSELLELLGYAQ
jgi:hypothetical protein